MSLKRQADLQGSENPDSRPSKKRFDAATEGMPWSSNSQRDGESGEQTRRGRRRGSDGQASRGLWTPAAEAGARPLSHESRADADGPDAAKAARSRPRGETTHGGGGHERHPETIVGRGSSESDGTSPPRPQSTTVQDKHLITNGLPAPPSRAAEEQRNSPAAPPAATARSANASIPRPPTKAPTPTPQPRHEPQPQRPAQSALEQTLAVFAARFGWEFALFKAHLLSNLQDVRTAEQSHLQTQIQSLRWEVTRARELLQKEMDLRGQDRIANRARERQMAERLESLKGERGDSSREGSLGKANRKLTEEVGLLRAENQMLLGRVVGLTREVEGLGKKKTNANDSSPAESDDEERLSGLESSDESD
ncbi:uncharacterized protein K489DRAFT_412516 [Dissoconium aciculare CBS 342.82]|uniref:Uncharacterized protein n=1 Tax=Dissoconium aciculare CBS 342.82 TaxID=1314786 RepID=A0A6J3LYW6_9PEZI|nr:uncharacterized protein K489DRAFT_412516 [Dissoconium aciculare CBS 342.82]KAF1819827.1 hypothetical protein K489DRAFT_412516 [Dissoconium aciculare CBS 342.82]